MNHSPAAANGASPSSPTHNHFSPGMAGSSESSANNKLELSGEGAASISELSPNPEQLPINIPKRPAVPAFSGEGHAPAAGEPTMQPMQPSLDLSPRSANSEHSGAGGGQHIMSWMDYDQANPGPAR